MLHMEDAAISCHVSYCKLHVIARGPRSYQLQEVRKGLCGNEKIVNAGLQGFDGTLTPQVHTLLKLTFMPRMSSKGLHDVPQRTWVRNRLYILTPLHGHFLLGSGHLSGCNWGAKLNHHSFRKQYTRIPTTLGFLPGYLYDALGISRPCLSQITADIFVTPAPTNCSEDTLFKLHPLEFFQPPGTPTPLRRVG